MPKTPIAYYGGKLAIIHHIIPLIPDHIVYTEAFLGGGTVFFAKKPSPNETINDRLDIVVNFYQVLKNNYPALKRMIDGSLVSRTMHHRAMRLLRNKRSPKVERAWAFWFCSNFSYSNKIGGGLKYSNDQSVSAPRILRNKKTAFTELLVARIENVTIENNDAIKVISRRNHPSTGIYLRTTGTPSTLFTGLKLQERVILLSMSCLLAITLSIHNSPLSFRKRKLMNLK